MAPERVCKDCEPRPKPLAAPHPGPRCHNHHRVFVKASKAARHETYVQRTYGLEPGEYERLLEAQGGVCAICHVATGRSKRLAVDHRHSDGKVRGILCGPDNIMIGRLGPAALRRAADYLEKDPE